MYWFIGKSTNDAPPLAINSPSLLLKSIFAFTSLVENAIPSPLSDSFTRFESTFNLKSEVSALNVIF